MTTHGSPLLLCSHQELLLAVRSRWTQIFAAVFACLSLAVAASGYILSGGHGFQDFSRTAVSLVQLVLLLVPLTALVIGVLSLSPERGASEILFSQPVSRTTILLGRLLGLFQALAGAQAIGFGAAGLVVFSQAGEQGIGGFLLLVLGSLLMTAVFLGIAAVVACGSAGRSRPLALALVIWFVAVLLYDVAALGLASLLPSGSASRLLILAVLLNPVDAVRTGTLLAIEGTAAFGAASLAFLRFTGGAANAAWLLSFSLLVWVVLPAAFAAWLLKKADL
ncbi:MAG TPA: ABC transporter permease subunit [Candidatus Acidoferrales bacterium]|nr:ABC transporter permease subunit [Candidatus Acidoferrales bacterium]